MCSNVIGGDSSDEIESNFFDDEFGNADNELQQIHELPEKNLKKEQNSHSSDEDEEEEYRDKTKDKNKYYKRIKKSILIFLKKYFD